MPATKAYSSFFPAGTSVLAGTTKGSPTIGNTVDARTAYGGEMPWRMTNGGALNSPCTITFQTSPDGSNWFDYYTVYGADNLNGTVTNGPSVPMGRGGMYLRAIAYGNTNNACTVEGGIELVTGL